MANNQIRDFGWKYENKMKLDKKKENISILVVFSAKKKLGKEYFD